MAQREVGMMELLGLMTRTVGRRRSMVMLGASIVCGVYGAKEWPEVIAALRDMGYSIASVYNLRADFQAVAVVVAEAEGEPVSWMAVMDRCRREAGQYTVLDCT